MIMHYCTEVTALLEFIDVDYHKRSFTDAVYLGAILIQLGHAHLHGSVGHLAGQIYYMQL